MLLEKTCVGFMKNLKPAYSSFSANYPQQCVVPGLHLRQALACGSLKYGSLIVDGAGFV
jgi:hypothetical protein